MEVAASVGGTAAPLDLLRTPLGARHESLGARMVPFSGWLMPIQYAGLIAEHLHTRIGRQSLDHAPPEQRVIVRHDEGDGLTHLRSSGCRESAAGGKGISTVTRVP